MMDLLLKKIIIYMYIIGIITYQNFIFSSTANNSQSWPIITRNSRSILPADLQAEAKNTKMAIFKPTADQLITLYQNYPNGTTLFTKNSDLAAKFDTMIQSIKNNKDSIEFLRKIQIKALNQLYGYLMKIYTNLNIITPGIADITDTTSPNIDEYFKDENRYAINKKKLIMNHFINLIQSQFSSIIVSCLPTISFDIAATFGQMFIENDSGLDLTEFVKKQTNQTVIAQQTAYLQTLYQCLDFYQTYTAYLSKIDNYGTNQFSTIAEDIQKKLSQPENHISMNPPMFFYDIESIRSIRFIPFVSGTIPKNSSLIPWASTIVNAAIKNLMSNNHPVAYFKDNAGIKTQNQSQATSLYLLTEVGENLFEEELLPQPGWLNNQSGCIRILSACLGDISSILGMGILDETIEGILQKALKINSATTKKK